MSGEDMSGALFKNDRKREGKKDPDYNGSITINGQEYWLSAWINESKKDGRKFMGIRAKPKEQQQAAPAAAPVQEDLDEDIPF